MRPQNVLMKFTARCHQFYMFYHSIIYKALKPPVTQVQKCQVNVDPYVLLIWKHGYIHAKITLL